MYPIIYPKSPKSQTRLGQNSNGAQNSCRPVYQNSPERHRSLIENTPAFFNISDNFGADGSEPAIELSYFDVTKANISHIQSACLKHDVDPDLISAIMYLETTHGYYDKINPWRNTILPMNVSYTYWKDLGVSEASLEQTANNIDIGALILRRIQDRVSDPSVAKIASIYNFLGKEVVSDYGARAATIYKQKLWKKTK
ncbi:hypothetical protein QCD60_27860 [Pokkaliibacter sp. MBI-7]|uniref:hypothetical protein n=1 Tax=Pokkaliibacter sp. MBI-7 TaxID=3040600 RepID=UPI002447FFA5|nr:hypothetical protein [Pokkaliibacter sp. MBI-7]MDH2436353.1 hypothetical protein [Pokkaliibacter sp. MBI-7]